MNRGGVCEEEEEVGAGEDMRETSVYVGACRGHARRDVAISTRCDAYDIMVCPP